jgi:hypothetical protein
MQFKTPKGEGKTWFKTAGRRRWKFRRTRLPVVAVRIGHIAVFACCCVGDLCTVTWRGEKYRVECTPSFLLALAVAPASAEGASYIDIYRQHARQVMEMRRYREAAGRFEKIE